MSGSRQPMAGMQEKWTWGAVLRIGLPVLVLIGLVDASRAQEPPLDVPRSGALQAKPGDAVPIEEWLVYPSIRTYSTYTDNLFNSPIAPISVLGFGVSPKFSAEWTNGIHTSNLYGTLDHIQYPTRNDLDTLDGNAGFTQKYSPLPDLTFRLNGDYNHKTIASGLQNSIPSSTGAPETVVLPNGNTVLPNGVILSPEGVPVGQTTPSLSANGQSFISPNDQYTGTLSIDKIFNHGILSVNGALARTNYETNSSQDSASKTLTEHAGVWLGSLFYAYSDGSIADTAIVSSGPTTAYRIIGGIGTRQFGFFRGSVYYGHQGSRSTGSAGGEVYGGSLSYYPTSVWTISASINETVNISSQISTSPLALSIPVQSPVQIPLSASTRITGTSLSSSYTISPQWSASENVAYTRYEYIGSSRLDHSWSAGATLNYSMWRDLALSWQYQHTNFLSNAPFTSFRQNLFTMSTNYTF
jgi:Putative beta-barrel porin 2